MSVADFEYIKRESIEAMIYFNMVSDQPGPNEPMVMNIGRNCEAIDRALALLSVVGRK